MNKKKKPIKKTPYDIRQNTAYFVKNRLPAFILAGLIIFWTIASIFGLIGYCRSKPKNTAMVTASAMTVEDYELGKEIIIDLPFLYSPIFYDGDMYFVDFYPRLVLGDGYTALAVSDDYNRIGDYYNFGATLTVPTVYNPFTDSLNETNDIFISTNFDTTANFIDNYGRLTVEYDLDFTNAFVGTIRIYAEYPQEESFTLFEFDFEYDYFDSNFIVLLPLAGETLTSGDGAFVYSHTAYGFPIVDFINIYDEYRKLEGGYERGYQAGSLQGYTEGKNAGYENGYQRGKADGLALADVATFEDLMSSVFDVPIRAFTSLFNFDILGVNMANFFLSILTLCIVLAVVKMLI